MANVGGRTGAAQGPEAALAAFRRLKGRDGVEAAWAGDRAVTPLTGDVAANHRQAADAVRAAQAESGLTVVVGGGHDHGYSHLLGVRETLPKGARLGCINIDAHLDVREARTVITSGSPFWLALENGVLDPRRFVELGVQRLCNAPELWDYVESRGVKVVPYERLRGGKGPAAFAAELKKLSRLCDAVVVSLDLDACAQAFAPGVSAPVSEGFAPEDVFAMMAAAGRDRKVASLGIFELNPAHDVDGRTARLAASAAYHFVAAALGR